MLQGALADIEQPAHITVVQPIGVHASFPECLVAGLGKAENLVPQLCPVRIRNDKISHSFIIVLFVILSYWFNKTFVRLAFHRIFLPAKVESVCHTSKHEGTVGK